MRLKHGQTAATGPIRAGEAHTGVEGRALAAFEGFLRTGKHAQARGVRYALALTRMYADGRA